MKSKLPFICMLFISATITSYAQSEKDIPPPPPPPKEPKVVTQKVDVRVLKPGVPKEIALQKFLNIPSPPPPPQNMVKKEIPAPPPPPKKPNSSKII